MPRCSFLRVILRAHSRSRAPDRQTAPSVRLWPQRRPHNVIHLDSSGHMVVTARQPRRPSRKGGESDTRRSGGVTLTRADTPISHRMGGPLDRQVPLPPERPMRGLDTASTVVGCFTPFRLRAPVVDKGRAEVGAGCAPTSRSPCSFAPRLERMDSIFRPPTLRLALQTLHCGHAARSYRGGLHASHAASR